MSPSARSAAITAPRSCRSRAGMCTYCRFILTLALSLSLCLSLSVLYMFIYGICISYIHIKYCSCDQQLLGALSLSIAVTLYKITLIHTHTQIHNTHVLFAVNLRIRSWSLCMNSSHIHCMAFLLSLLFKCREIRYDIMEDHSFLGHSYDSPSIMRHSMLRWHCPQCSRTENPLALSLFPSTLAPPCP